MEFETDPLASSHLAPMCFGQPDHAEVPKPAARPSATGATEPCRVYLRNQHRKKRKRKKLDTSLPSESPSISDVDVSTVRPSVHSSDLLVLDVNSLQRKETALIQHSALRHCISGGQAVHESDYILQMYNNVQSELLNLLLLQYMYARVLLRPDMPEIAGITVR
jgi:hypothetical protein